jgi:hypothetical protein
LPARPAAARQASWLASWRLVGYNRIMKNYLLVFGLGVILFIATSLYSYSDICCMFSASRYYGWPYPYLSLQKTVDTFAEASKIKTDSVLELTKNGWQFNFSGDMLKTSPFGALGNFILDIVISFFSAGLLFLLSKKLFHILKA